MPKSFKKLAAASILQTAPKSEGNNCTCDECKKLAKLKYLNKARAGSFSTNPDFSTISGGHITYSGEYEKKEEERYNMKTERKTKKQAAELTKEIPVALPAAMPVDPIKLPENREETIVYLVQLVQAERDRFAREFTALKTENLDLVSQVSTWTTRTHEAQDKADLQEMEIEDLSNSIKVKDEEIKSLQAQLLEAQTKRLSNDLQDGDRKAVASLFGKGVTR